jgi:hypothetical protein
VKNNINLFVLLTPYKMIKNDEYQYERDLLYDLQDLMEENNFEKMAQLIQKYNYDINYDDDKNSLIITACETFNKKGIAFCVENEICSNRLGYGGANLMRHYSENPIETLEMIDYIIKNGGDMWQLYHRSLTWDYIDIHKYLLNKWKSLINFDWAKNAFCCGCQFGNYDSIQHCFEIDEYKTIITQEIINEGLLDAVLVDCVCYENRYNLIKFLVKEKNAKIDENYKNSKALMERINTFLTETTASHYNSINTNFEDRYMPNIFKKGLTF